MDANFDIEVGHRSGFVSDFSRTRALRRAPGSGSNAFEPPLETAKAAFEPAQAAAPSRRDGDIQLTTAHDGGARKNVLAAIGAGSRSTFAISLAWMRREEQMSD